MEFTNLVDLIQVFANEYCHPSFIILFYVEKQSLSFNENTLRDLFKFITSEVIVISKEPSEFVDIIVGNILPFESHSFDLIISFQGITEELKRVLKPNGKLLINEIVIDALETYKCANVYFSVL